MNDVSRATAAGLDRFFASYYRLRPVNATFTGVHDYDGRLPDWSPDGLDRAAAEMRALRLALADAPAPDDLPALRDVGRRDRALALSFLDVQLAEHDSRHFIQRNPSLASGELAFGLISLITRPFAPAAERASALVSRLEAAPAFLTGARASLTEPTPTAWRDRAVRECGAIATLLDDGLTCWGEIERLEPSLMDRIVAAAGRARQAVDEFRGWLTDGIRLDPDYAGCGAALFDTLLSRGHWTRRTRAELLQEATTALDAALAALDARARAVAPGGWPEVQERLATRHPDAAGYLGAYARTWQACRAAAEAHELVSWPDFPIRYVPIPPQTRRVAPSLYYLFYRSPAPFDPPAVYDYVVTPIDDTMTPDEQEQRLRANNDSVIKLNHVVHHGAIGHHVQNYRAYHGESEIGRVAAVDCASRIGMFLGGTMAEGWACYATELMDEAGFLTAEESVAEQHTRARLLSRAVADISLHQGSADIDTVAGLYRDRLGMSDAAARGEAIKNSMFPGAAVMYWLGTAAIRELRARRDPAEPLRAFHDRFLAHGSIPVPLICDLMG